MEAQGGNTMRIQRRRILQWFARHAVSVFIRDLFLNVRFACKICRVDSIEKLRQQVNEWRRGLDDKATLRSLYLFTFAYAKSASTRHLDLETAIAYWTLFLEKRDPRVLQWIEFLRTQDLRAINKDLYCLFFDFLYSTDASYSDYDVNAAWVGRERFVRFVYCKLMPLLASSYRRICRVRAQTSERRRRSMMLHSCRVQTSRLGTAARV